LDPSVFFSGAMRKFGWIMLDVMADIIFIIYYNDTRIEHTKMHSF